jgi:hypothetical protein
MRRHGDKGARLVGEQLFPRKTFTDLSPWDPYGEHVAILHVIVDEQETRERKCGGGDGPRWEG